MRYAWVAPIALAAAVSAHAQPAPRAAIERAMAASDAGWNAGDLDRFMALYSNSAETSYIAGTTFVRGKAAIARRYAPRFARGVDRGTLSISVLDYRQLGPDHALVVARYRLVYRNGKVDQGPTSLVFRRERGSWRIVADHSG